MGGRYPILIIKQMKLKKGSKEAKEFMSKIRARKKQKNLPDRKHKKINLEIKPIQKINAVKEKSEFSVTKYLLDISVKANIEALKDRKIFEDNLTIFINNLKFQLKNKTLTKEQILSIKKHIITAKKQYIANMTIINILKKLI